MSHQSSTQVYSHAYGQLRSNSTCLTVCKMFLTIQSGGAVGLAVGNAILQNVFVRNLPDDLPSELRQSLLKTMEVPSGLDVGTTARIREACRQSLVLEKRSSDSNRHARIVQRVHLPRASCWIVLAHVRIHQGTPDLKRFYD